MEELHLLVQEEGRAAKHAAFSVPVEPLVSPQPDSEQSSSVAPNLFAGKPPLKKPPTTPRQESKRDDQNSTSRPKRLSESAAQGSRLRSASTGRDKRSELQNFHWTILRGTLVRTMEEIFYLCEQSESIDNCKVMMLMMENYVRDFKSLIQYLNVKWGYENTPPPERPTSIAWEVRRSSPTKCFLALRALRRNEKPEEIRACLVDYLAQELMLSQAIGLSPSDIANVASQTINLEAAKKEMEENKPEIKQHESEPLVDIKIENTEIEKVDDEVLATPLEDTDVSQENVVASDSTLISNTESASVSSQTDPCDMDEITESISQDITDSITEADVVVKEKKEESCQTDAIPLENYVLDISELEKEKATETITVSATPAEIPALVKPRTPSRLIVTRPSMAAAVVRGVARSTVSRGRGVTADIRPSTVQPRAVRSLTEIRGGLSGRGLARKSLEPRLRAATTGSTVPTKQPTTRIAQTLATLPNKPNIGVGRGVKKLPERVSKSGPVIRAGGISHREIEGDGFLGDQRSNSSSSINSSSSRSSWADKVKGSNSALVLAATIEVHSVEDLLHRKTEAAPREEDGWRMVKARSRSKISPVTSKCEPILTRSNTNIIKVDQENKVSLRIFAQNRFHQPSAARSLPTLALNIPQKTKEIVQKTRPSSSKSETSQSQKKPSLSVKPITKSVIKSETKTSVKSPSSPDIPSFKKSPSKLSRQNTSNEKLESVKKESVDDNNKNLIKKENIKNNNISQKNLKVNTSLKKDIKADEIIKNLKNDKPDLVKLELEINAPDTIKSEVTTPVAQSEKGDSDREEEEQRKFDDEVQRKTEELCAEEKRLEKQIQELQTEVDLAKHHTDLDVGPELSEKLHAQYRYMADGNELPPYDPTDVIEQMRELEIGHPGRALELHQKLSSPSRRRTPAESVRSLHTKQAKAQEKRAQLMQEKWYKIQELDKKIEEVRAAKLQNTELKREQLELKLKRAEQKRNRHLQEIARKAHDEEEKLKEIAFINELEAQNKRHDFMALCQEQEERLQGIQEERQRKQEEKAAKEAAVEERKKVLAAEREAKLKDMQEKRRQKEERIGRELQEKEKERMELAREKARDREERLQAIQAAQLANQEELQKKIQAKQEEYARRHDENIEQIRQRALECCLLKTDVAPRLAPYDTHKLCTMCNVLIGSDVYLVSHLRGRQHQEAVKAQLGGKDLTREEIEGFSLKHITDAPASDTDNKLAMDRERQKALKKRCKKIRLRMAAKGQEYENSREIQNKQNSPQKPRIQKCLRDVERLLTAQGKGLWSDAAITSLERALAEIGRILDKKNSQDQAVFLALGGFNYLLELFNLAMDTAPGAQLYIPTKCFVTVCNAYQLACTGCVDNCRYVILSNKISTIMDLLLHRLACTAPTRRNGGSSTGPLSSGSSLNVDNVSGALMRLLAMLLEQAVLQLQTAGNEEQQQLMPRVQDVVSYAVSAGVLEKLAACCGSVRDPIDDDPPGAVYLLAALRLLRALVACARAGGSAAVRQDVSQLGATLRVTELVGGVSMLYGMLLHQGAPPRGSLVAPPPLPPHTIAVAKATLTLLREVAEMDLALFQGVLGAEGMSLQFRHLASHLLWACSGGGEHSDDLLQEVIRVVGFFAVRNHDNQMTIQSGFTPTVLQQFCNLPFAYFSEERLACVLLPTLLACCWGNAETRAVLEQELSFQLLEDFRLSKAGQQDSLVALLGASNSTS